MSLPRAGLYRRLPTEQPNPNSRKIERKSALAIVRKINRENRKVAAAVLSKSAGIARAATAIADSLRSGGTIFLVGAGNSGRLCVMEAAEIPPTFGMRPGQVQALMAGGRSSVFLAREDAEDNPKAGAREISKRASKGDVVIGVAASGITPFVQGALRAARNKRCKTILVTSNSKPRIKEADIVISPVVGPEIIAGSTRMKAGTAAKLVLNSMTTVAMIRLGKVYDGWMVDLKPSSRKLRLRAIYLVSRLGGVPPSTATELLTRAGWNAKASILAAKMKRGTTADRIAGAKKMLKVYDGSLSKTLEHIKARE